MILDAADLQSRAFMLAGNAADVCPDTFLDVFVNPSLTILGAENEMVKK